MRTMRDTNVGACGEQCGTRARGTQATHAIQSRTMWEHAAGNATRERETKHIEHTRWLLVGLWLPVGWILGHRAMADTSAFFFFHFVSSNRNCTNNAPAVSEMGYHASGIGSCVGSVVAVARQGIVQRNWMSSSFWSHTWRIRSRWKVKSLWGFFRNTHYVEFEREGSGMAVHVAHHHHSVVAVYWP
mmetsp:Transcript_30483/g.62875  ORF Transcript_30483/g.62875 Transcript_30483/m.62875 type:complete len:187 (+) Transcript_30483:1665-2225(+)